MKYLKLVVVTCLVTLCLSSKINASEFSLQGSTWLGGGLTYSSIGFENVDTRISSVRIEPILRFFPVDHFMMGPIIAWNGNFIEHSNANQFDIGAEIGGVFSSDNKTFTYLRTGGSISLLSGNAMADSYTGFTVPIAGGVIFPCGDIFGIQLEPYYSITWIEESSLNVFGVNIGICGMGKKSLVSIMQGVSALSILLR